MKSLNKFSLIYILVLTVFISGCDKKSEKTQEQLSDSSKIKPVRTVQKGNIAIDVFDFKSFKPFLHQKSDMVYVINFWATWCIPCIKELPAFKKIQQTYKDEKVKIILVSLDFADKIKSQLIPFIKKKGLKSKVILLDDSDANSWISEVNENWSGAIPATLIYNKQERNFYPQPFTQEKLEKEINKFLTNKN